ncbi:uncharacterized protein [Linepithema humile]|uniref:uncharacterized protein isoform X2 n=1 Tax=Linepithema humile TaxID=83485 RepID=UPI00351EBB1F
MKRDQASYRPSAEAVSGTGIDTCNVENDAAGILTGDMEQYVEINMEHTDGESHEDENNIPHQEEVINKKRKKSANSGRKSYQSTLESYTEKWLKSQKTMLETMIDRQDKMHKDIVEKEMEKQREWEQREMEKERDFQREQNNLIMQTFLQSMHTLRPSMPLYSPNNTPVMPLKLISLNSPRTVSATITSKIAEKSQTDVRSSAENLRETQ